MSTTLKRTEFDVILPPSKGKGSGGGGGGDVKGVQQLGSGDSGSGDENATKSKPYAPPVPINSSSDDKKDKKESDNSKDGSGESEPGKDKGKSGNSEDNSEIKATARAVNIGNRGVGGILSDSESRKLQEDLGVEYEDSPSAKEIKEIVKKLQPHLSKDPKLGNRNQGGGKGNSIRLLPDVIAKMLNSIVDWKALLKKYIGTVLGKSYEAIMPNRRFVASGDYVYGSRRSKTKLKTCVIAIDVSGSIGMNELAVMVNEVKGLANAHKIRDFELVYFDDGIQKIVKMSEGQVKAYKPEIVGGGGTSFKEPLEYMDQVYKKGNLDLAIFMTDGYANLELPIPRFKDKFIWMILDHPSFKAPFGNKVVFVDVEQGKGSL